MSFPYGSSTGSAKLTTPAGPRPASVSCIPGANATPHLRLEQLVNTTRAQPGAPAARGRARTSKDEREKRVVAHGAAALLGFSVCISECGSEGVCYRMVNKTWRRSMSQRQRLLISPDGSPREESAVDASGTLRDLVEQRFHPAVSASSIRIYRRSQRLAVPFPAAHEVGARRQVSTHCSHSLMRHAGFSKRPVRSCRRMR